MAQEPLLKLQPVRHSIYFRDGKRKIDAILVYDSNKKSTTREMFLENLRKAGIKLEYQTSAFKESRVYVKVHASDAIIKKNAKIYGIPIKCEQITKFPEPIVPHNIMKTILNDPHPDPNDPVAKRAWATISKEKPRDITFSERNSIVFTILSFTKFGQNSYQIGLPQLILSGQFIAAYPLHDGDWHWPANDLEPLNDRQLLAKYWASFTMCHKQQPLNIVEMYFGPEVAMYFGWLGFYNQMLIIASIMGISTFLYGILNVKYFATTPISEACNSETFICPFCRTCKPRKLKTFCTEFKIAYLNDNIGTVLFACGMSFWATLFMEFWKRKYNTLSLRWNFNNVVDDVYRPEFQATVTNTRQHPYTGEMELFMPLSEKVKQLTVSVAVIMLMILIVLCTIVSIVLYECVLKTYAVEKMYISVSSSFITVLIMLALRKIYGQVALWLTNRENPRTRYEYDKSYMIKMIVFSIINSYGKLFYFAFFKGKFFTYPGDPSVRNIRFPLAAEVCDPTGCVSEIFILLATITIIKPIFNNVVEIITSALKIWLHKLKILKQFSLDHLETWEQDFNLNATKYFKIMEELEEMVVQYGFVTLVVAGFPLAPFLALINNMFEIRIDATKLIKYFRRAASNKATSISVWFDTLQAVTYLAVITNALFITFTSNFVPQMVYYFCIDESLKGFSEFLISKFIIDDNYYTHTNITECWYNGQRYPPEDINAYQHTYLYFYIFVCRLAFAIIFVLTVLLLTGILAYIIPDIPSDIQDLINYNNRKARERSVL